MDENEEEKKQEDVVIPEQLDDEDFEKEKEELKKQKKEKKLKKKSKEPEYDENGNEIKTKKSKKKAITISIIVILVLAIIGGIAAFIIINMNKPENIVLDFATYFNNAQWKELDNCIDMRGFYTLVNMEEKDYPKFDSEYKAIEKNEKYAEFTEFLDSIKDDKETILKNFFKDYKLKVNQIDSVEKIENTESLYKVRVNLTLTYDGEELTDIYDVYVTKIDKKYKIVGGEFALMIEIAYEYSQNY